MCVCVCGGEGEFRAFLVLAPRQLLRYSLEVSGSRVQTTGPPHLPAVFDAGLVGGPLVVAPTSVLLLSCLLHNGSILSCVSDSCAFHSSKAQWEEAGKIFERWTS